MAINRAFNQLVQDPIFVVGAARSGTTWVFDILSSHPEVAGVYESWLFRPNNGLGALFTSAHWPPRRSGLGRLLKREELVVYAQDMAVRILSHALKPEHRFLMEKSPPHLFSMELISEIFPGSRFIHVLRDGRDVNVSVRLATESWVPGWRATFGRSIRTSAHAWRSAVARARHDGEKLGDRFFEIRYEEICQDPSDAYCRLFDFCGIPYDDQILRHVFGVTDFKLNFEPNEAGFRRGGRVGDWREYFSIIDALVFNLTAGDMLIELGYAKNRCWFPRFFSRYPWANGRGPHKSALLY